MYFPSVLSAPETVYTVIIIPKMLLQPQAWVSPLTGRLCHSDVLLHHFGYQQLLLLTAMGYDRYVAICHPLRYTVIMNRRVCIQLVWGLRHRADCGHDTGDACIQVTFLCHKGGPLLLWHPAQDKLSCIDTHCQWDPDFDQCPGDPGSHGIGFHFQHPHHIHHPQDCFSWREEGLCHLRSHLTVVIVNYGCASIAYLKPKSENSKGEDQLISVTYTVITPLLNPVV